MTSASYEAISEEIYEQLLSKLERKDDESLRFAASGAAETVLNDDVLLRLFATLEPLQAFQNGATLQQHAGTISGDEFIQRIKQRELHRFLAILIFGVCPLKIIRLFVHKLVAVDEWPVRSRAGRPFHDLPADRDDLGELFNNQIGMVDKILSSQACFCPVHIKGREITVSNPQYNRLPYLKVPKEIGRGSFGAVYKVRIAKGYFYDPVSKQWNSKSMPLARKDYIIKPEYEMRVHEEHNVINRIIESAAGKCPNILETFCSLKVGGTYSLLMPLAMFDLRHYMMEHHKHSPGTTMAKAKMILSAEGLADGLDFLHTRIQSPDRMEDLVCYHMDLKPNNILLFRDDRDNPESDRFIWKLSDFGMARVKVRPQDSERATESNFTSWFIRRNQEEDPTPSATINRRGEGTYLAPESLSAIPSMKTPSDVWALGCILSVLFTYLEAGSPGITTYQELRANGRKSDGFDRFFLRGRVLSRIQSHPTVEKWHHDLVKQANTRDQQEGKIVGKFLKFLEESVLKTDPRDRCTAKEVKKMLTTTYRDYNKLQPRPITAETLLSHDEQIDPDRPETRNGIEMWRVSPHEAYKGCEISPDGTLVVFWTDIKLVLFTSQSILTGEREAKSAGEFTLPLRNCIWKSIALTNKYLVASLTGTSFDCFIFNLEGGILVDANFSRGYQASLPQLRDIQKLAISPSSEMMACMLQHPDGEINSHHLFHAKIKDLIKISKRIDFVPNPASEAPNLDTSLEEPWSLVSLGQSGGYVTQLMFSSRDRIYIATRPNLAGKRREHKSLIISVSLTSKEISVLIIEPRGFDGASTLVPLFTTFTPFHGEPPICAIITREKSMQIQNVARDDVTHDLKLDIANYRILNLMMDQSNERIFALGIKSGNNGIWAIDIAVPRPNSKLVENGIARIPSLWYGDEFVSRLVTDDDEKHILVASLAGGRRTYSAIFKIGLA